MNEHRPYALPEKRMSSIVKSCDPSNEPKAKNAIVSRMPSFHKLRVPNHPYRETPLLQNCADNS